MGSDSKDELMEATCRALCRHGYADLTIQGIADETEKGKSLIYYHYDDKEDLMESFLENIAEQVEARIDDGSDNPEQALICFLDLVLGLDNEETWEMRKALLEVRSAAPYNSAFARRFEAIHDALESRLEEILEQNEVTNPSETAEIMLYAIEGAVRMKISENNREDLYDVKKRLIERFVKT